MDLLAFRDPTGRVYIMSESTALPPLAHGYEWTRVVQPDVMMADDDVSEPEPAPSRPNKGPGFLETVIPLLIPRTDQSPQERAQELIDALPEEIRSQLGKLMRALAPPRPPELPPFPGARQ